MNRLSFLKKFGIGVAAATVTPLVFAQESKPLGTIQYRDIPKSGRIQPITATKRSDWNINGSAVYSPADVLRLYKQTGNLVYKNIEAEYDLLLSKRINDAFFTQLI
jgi:hypothetical protein